MLDVFQRCFPERMDSELWQDRLHEIFGSFGRSLADDAALASQLRRQTHTCLGLPPSARLV